LAAHGISVTIAGRDLARAESFAKALGVGHRGLTADVTNANSCRASLQDQSVAVNCAGPFAPFADALLEACLDRGCHYVDIADDRDYTRLVRSKGELFRQRNLAADFWLFGFAALFCGPAFRDIVDAFFKHTRRP